MSIVCNFKLKYFSPRLVYPSYKHRQLFVLHLKLLDLVLDTVSSTGTVSTPVVSVALCLTAVTVVAEA